MCIPVSTTDDLKFPRQDVIRKWVNVMRWRVFWILPFSLTWQRIYLREDGVQKDLGGPGSQEGCHLYIS